MLHAGQQSSIGLVGSLQGEHRGHDAFSLGTLGDMLVDFFGDERHEGMYHLHEILEYLQGGLQGLPVDRCLISRFHHLQIPARELVGEQLEGSHQSLVEAILGVEVIYLCHLGTHLSLHPINGLGTGQGLVYIGGLPSLYQTEGIPYLVAEVGSLLAEVFLEEDIVAGRSSQQHAHAYAIGTILVYETYGVGAVAQ